eukprot:TRINITY_DN47331_c0_g1_i1.p1 TRINITY_DN47331_c0_g1~~TRINITY_DN47331_c0_g1_i1.p1  ORF type:complete len:1019 (-),score=137.11 TRINITY_DN47331_c0_g1_i1:128-3082(-)
MSRKNKAHPFTPADKIYNRIFWDDQLNPDDFEVGYEDRFKGLMYMPVRNWRTGEDETSEVPFHRIRNFRCQGQIVWNRTTRFSVIDKIAQGISPAQAVMSFAPKENQPLMSVVRPGRWDSEKEAWTPVDTTSAAAPSAMSQTNLKVVSYNILFDTFHTALIHTKQRLPMLVQELQKADADIVGLQEVTVPILNTILLDDWIRQTYYISDITAESITPSGQVILSKLPFTSVSLHNFSEKKRAAFARVKVNGVDVTLCCVHLVSDYAADAITRRQNQLNEVMTQMVHADHCILFGDFNFGDEAEEQKAVDWGEYLDVWKVLKPTEPGFTFDVTCNTLADITAQFHRYPRRLDRILVRSTGLMAPSSTNLIGTQAQSVKVMVPKINEVGDEIGSKLQDAELFCSDHFGLSCELKLDEKFAASQAKEADSSSSIPQRVPAVMKTALVVIPPLNCWPKIQAIREKYDPSCNRWPPHVNVLWPFVPQPLFPQFTPTLWDVAREIKPFTIKLSNFKSFDNQNAVLWLEPECEERALERLRMKLEPAFPMCKSKHTYTPHMTVGQFNKSEIAKHSKELAKDWVDIEFPVEELHLIARENEDDIFHIIHTVKLGSAEPPSYPTPTQAFPTLLLKGSGESDGYSSTEDASKTEAAKIDTSGMDITKMVMDRPTWGKKKLQPYYPKDALEQWLLKNTHSELARNLPTHISQLGGMYHIDSTKLDEYLEAWAESLKNAENVPFYVEEIRGDVFRLYVDIDIKSTLHEAFPLVECGWLNAILMHTHVFFNNEEHCDVVVTECHGKWDDNQDKDACFKSGFRLFFTDIWVDSRTYVMYLKTLACVMAKSFPTPYKGRPKKSGWKDIIDTKAIEWNRGRLHGTIKRRRNLKRMYSLLGVFEFQAPATMLQWVVAPLNQLARVTAEIAEPASDGKISGGTTLKPEATKKLQEDPVQLLFATTIRMWETAETKGFADYQVQYKTVDSVNREYQGSRMPNW